MSVLIVTSLGSWRLGDVVIDLYSNKMFSDLQDLYQPLQDQVIQSVPLPHCGISQHSCISHIVMIWTIFMGNTLCFGEFAEGLDTFTRINQAYINAKNRPYKVEIDL